ncbi:MAG TPA: hypothetical protein VGM84_24200 [Steroidobacteraceae bacterium]|jgi:uncharacterized membrane protein YeaQ/YmgE (transglycosylase-associated protein family)
MIMTIVAFAILSVLVGWLATLTLQSDMQSLAGRDFVIATLGAGVASVIVARYFGITATGEFGFTLIGITATWAGALILLSISNWFRFGQVMCCRRARRGGPTTY